MPVYRLHKAKQLAYVRIAGRMIYLGRTYSAESWQNYRRVVAEWLGSGKTPLSYQRAPLTIADLVVRYRDWASTYYRSNIGSESPVLGAIEAAVRPLETLYSIALVTTFGPVALKAVRHEMVTSGLCRAVVNQRIGWIKRMFRWAVSEELISPETVSALAAVDQLRRGRTAARESQPVKPVEDDHVDAVLPFLPPTLNRMVQLQRLTGMRSGELCAMRPCDIDRSGHVWLYRPMSHKTASHGHERVVRIGPRGQALLNPLLEGLEPKSYVFTPLRACRERAALRRGASDAALLPADTNGVDTGNRRSRIGRCYNSRSYHRALCYGAWRAIEAGVLLPQCRWHPHQLRHAHATAIRKSRGLEAARVLLGHRSVSQTQEYAEADAGLANATAAALC